MCHIHIGFVLKFSVPFQCLNMNFCLQEPMIQHHCVKLVIREKISDGNL